MKLLFKSEFKEIKFKIKKTIKLRNPYDYIPDFQAFVKRIKGEKTPHFRVQFPIDKITGRTELPAKYLDFYCEDVKGEFLVTCIIFGQAKGKILIDYQRTFKLKLWPFVILNT